jgi:8-oxo-dGTP diphosphatase
MKVVAKAFAYITHGDRLLVFNHADFPEAGLQVPAGTIRAGETPEAAVLREAEEETGLCAFERVMFLGLVEFDARPFGKDEIHRRHFFHLSAQPPLLEEWRHYEREPDDAAGPAIAFDFVWLSLSDAAARLAPGHANYIPSLATRLGG